MIFGSEGSSPSSGIPRNGIRVGSDIRLGLLRIGFLNQPVDGNVIRDVVTQTMKLSTKARQGIAIDPLDLPIER